MQLQGTIKNIVSDGGYSSTNGYIYTFQMTIQCQTGKFTGQIGSKTQVYPIAIEQPIIVDMTETQYGVRFKKIDPKYAQQDAQNQQQQAPPSQAAQNAQQPAQVNKSGERDTGLSIERQACSKAAAHRFQGMDVSADGVLELANRFANFVKTGRTYFSGNEDDFLNKNVTEDDIPF